MWRSWDRPLVGTIFRLPDDHVLQRGVTFTILPDGRSMRVPVMNKLQVQAENQKHADDEWGGIMQALQNLIRERKTMPGESRRNAQGGHGRRGRHEGVGGGRRVGPGIAEGLRRIGGGGGGGGGGAPLTEAGVGGGAAI